MEQEQAVNGFLSEMLALRIIDPLKFSMAKEIADRIFVAGFDKGRQLDLHNRAKSVIQLTKNGDFIREFSSVKQASIALDGDKTTISKALSGAREHAFGFKWKYNNH